MTTNLSTAFDPDIIRSLAAKAYETEKFTVTLEKFARQFNYTKHTAYKILKFWSKPHFNSLPRDNLAILNLDGDSISVITQIRLHNKGKAKPWFGLYSDSHDNHGSLVKFSDKTGPNEAIITKYKELPNVEFLLTGVDNVEDIISSVKMIEEKGLRRAFIPFPLALLHNYDREVSGSYNRSLLFFIFKEIWEQERKLTACSPYV